MSMNENKMNNYSLMRVSTTITLAVALVLSACIIPLGIPTQAVPLLNNPPYEPSNPIPANGSINILVSTTLSWTGGDPDGDPVKYDVYFGTVSPPPLVVSNQSATSYTPSTMNYLTMYYWRIIAWDNQSASTAGPQWEFTTIAKPNSPPNTPSNPSPADHATDVIVSIDLGWTGGDPDSGDTVTYDVYFGNTTPPPMQINNQSELTYDLGILDFNILYYWQIVAWDDHGASTTGPIWDFTTKQPSGITVSITRPKANTLYVQDVERTSLPGNSIIYGPITISAEATADSGIDHVDFYIDDTYKTTVDTAPYNYSWSPLISFNGLTLKHTIRVIAYDKTGNNKSAELNITKWRFHPLPFILVGAALLSRFFLHTSIRGFVFNLQQSRIGTSFFALRIHYKTSGPFKSVRGVISFKQCTAGLLIGPIRMMEVGPFHKFAWISCTFLGDLRQGVSGLGRGGRLPLKLLDLFLQK
jgi:hypothetical protein